MDSQKLENKAQLSKKAECTIVHEHFELRCNAVIELLTIRAMNIYILMTMGCINNQRSAKLIIDIKESIGMKAILLLCVVT